MDAIKFMTFSPIKFLGRAAQSNKSLIPDQQLSQMLKRDAWRRSLPNSLVTHTPVGRSKTSCQDMSQGISQGQERRIQLLFFYIVLRYMKLSPTNTILRCRRAFLPYFYTAWHLSQKCLQQFWNQVDSANIRHFYQSSEVSACR